MICERSKEVPSRTLHLTKVVCRPQIIPVLTQWETTNDTAKSEYENFRTDTGMNQGNLKQPGWHISLTGFCRLKCLGLNSTVRHGSKVSGSPSEAPCFRQDRRGGRMQTSIGLLDTGVQMTIISGPKKARIKIATLGDFG